jgi:hypothetical protein
MTIARKILAFPLMVLMMASSSALANQQHLVAPSELAATLAQQVARQDADRAAIHEALTHPQVQRLAASMGVDLTRANAAIDTIRGAELERVASTARQVNQQLVGGASTIVISTTTIIIALLLLIVLILAVK